MHVMCVCDVHVMRLVHVCVVVYHNLQLSCRWDGYSEAGDEGSCGAAPDPV